MATQNSGHAPLAFSITHPFRPVRLLEVPDDLLDLITNHSSEKLKFKSARAQPQSAGSGSGSMSTIQQQQGLREPILHLCSSEKAWAVKQVSTSNSVYLMEPCKESASAMGIKGADDDGNGDGDTEMHDLELDSALFTADVGGVTAVAQVHNFLELHPVKLDLESITRTIVDLVPIYHPLPANEDIDLDFQASNDSKSSMSMADLIDDIAAPDGIVRRACGRLGVFEQQSEDRAGVRCFIPSTRALLTTWTKFAEACAIEKADFEQELYISRIAGIYLDDVEHSILEKMRKVDGMFETFGLVEDHDRPMGTVAGRRLKPIETSRFIAGLLLSSRNNGIMPVDEFMSVWTDLVPTAWVKSCNVDILIASDTVAFEVRSEDGDEVIQWKGASVARGVVLTSALLDGVGKGSGENGNNGATKGPFVTDKRRKWHEKFGAQRSKR